MGAAGAIYETTKKALNSVSPAMGAAVSAGTAVGEHFSKAKPTPSGPTNATAKPAYDAAKGGAPGATTRPGGPPAGQPVLTNSGFKINGQDMSPDQFGTYFAKSRASIGTPGAPLQDGFHLPMGGQMTVSNPGAPGGMPGAAGGGLPSQFTGMPTMYPVQQSAGQDIFGDTAELFKKRDRLTSEMDSFYAKNPLGNDLQANFNAIASQAGKRKGIDALNQQIQGRETIMGNLMGHMMGAQATTQAAGIRADADVQNTNTMAATQLATGKGKAEDPMKGPAGVFDSITKFMSNPEAFGALPADLQEQFKSILPQYINHLNQGYGVGIRPATDIN